VDTAIHEIGHTLGFPHEHQNPNAGIEWNEEAVYADLAGPPNNWPREQTFHNIIRKLNPGDVHGSAWDKDSIMHYPFKAGLINRPERYRTEALRPAPGLSPVDKEEVKSFYSPLQISDHRALQAFQFVRLTLAPRGQANFIINPASSRRYQFSTFGQADTVMALFEEVNGVPRFREADDDSGADRNAKFTARLFPGRRYFPARPSVCTAPPWRVRRHDVVKVRTAQLDGRVPDGVARHSWVASRSLGLAGVRVVAGWRTASAHVETHPRRDRADGLEVTMNIGLGDRGPTHNGN
jgi:hypothetical protein